MLNLRRWRLRKVMFLVPLLGLAALFPTWTASANTVDHFSVPVQVNPVDTTCGFPINVSATGFITLNLHFDNQDNFISADQVGSGNARITYTNPKNRFSVTTLPSPNIFTVKQDGIDVLVGAVVRLTVPGVGTLAMVTGKFLLDTSTGQFTQVGGQETPGFDFYQSIFAIPAVCNVFANPPKQK